MGSVIGKFIALKAVKDVEIYFIQHFNVERFCIPLTLEDFTNHIFEKLCPFIDSPIFIVNDIASLGRLIGVSLGK